MDKFNYEIMSADEKQRITRNALPIINPWGEEGNTGYSTSRLVYQDIKKAQLMPVGSHPLGNEANRDFSVFGNPITGQRIRDLIGNGREWTSTVGEKGTRVITGVSDRVPVGPLFLPFTYASYSERNYVLESVGKFRTIVRYPQKK
jgi:hypothetical protein